MDWFIGMIFSAVLGYIAYWQHSLSKSGLAGAIVVGTSVIGGIGWWGLLVLAFFFVSSSLISKLSSLRKRKNKKREEITAKGDRRDIVQVFANGGVAALLSIVYAITSDSFWMIMFSASLAAATSDTWASEIGRWSKQAPRDCLTWKTVAPGTSGAVSPLGTIASFLGALITALISLPLIVNEISILHTGVTLFIITISGWLGNWLDTIIGAKWQIRFQCVQCGTQTEQTIHCHFPTYPIQGIHWINNDVVNMICTLSGAVISLTLFILLT